MRDPVTLQKYHPNEVEDLDEEVSNRLVYIKEEQEENLGRRIERWGALEKCLKEKFKDIVFMCDGMKSPENIVEEISFHLEKLK